MTFQTSELIFESATPHSEILAGVCLGLLTYKPQFLILFPVVLLAGGYWDAIIAAALTFAGLMLATIAIFGLLAWVAFFHWLPLTSQALLSQDHAEWYKLQSLFGLVRMLGVMQRLHGPCNSLSQECLPDCLVRCGGTSAFTLN